MSRGSCFFVSLIKITSRWSRGWSLRYWREMVPLHGLEPGSGCPSPYERPLLYCGCLAGGPPPMFRSVHLPGPAHSSGGLDPISMFLTQKLLPAQRRHLVFPVVCVSLAPPMASPFSWWDPTPPDLHPLSHHPALFSPWLVPSSNTIYSSVWVLWWALPVLHWDWSLWRAAVLSVCFLALPWFMEYEPWCHCTYKQCPE